MTSAWEGFPNTVIEAQSYGAIPVMFDSFPIASWMVGHERDGFLIRPFDIDSMAQTIFELTRGNQMPEIMQSALENANRFEIETVGQMWQDLFGSLSERLHRQQKVSLLTKSKG